MHLISSSRLKRDLSKEENDSLDDEIRKYNAIGEKKVIEVEDEVFAGCELKVSSF